MSTSSETTRTAVISYCAHRRQRNGTRAHTQLKNTTPLSGRHSCARGARARCATHLPRAAEQRPVSHRSPQARTSGRAPPRSRRQKARPSAGNHHHNFCLITTHDHQTRASDEPPTKHAHEAPGIVTKPRRIGLSAFRRFLRHVLAEKNRPDLATDSLLLRRRRAPPLGPRPSRHPDRTSRWAPRHTTARTRSPRRPSLSTAQPF